MRRAVFVWILLLLLSACGRSPDSAAGTTSPAVLTSTTILADITRSVAGDRLQVGSLLPIGMDPHSYQATPQDLAKITESDLIIVNGAQYEQFLSPLLENTNNKKTWIDASAGIIPRSDARGIDPHMWLDPNLVVTYVENIRVALTHLDPAGEAVYKSNADAYVAALHDLDAWIVEQVDQIPSDKRLLVTNHEAFGYFAERYGFTVVGTVIQSFSTDAAPSAQQLAALIDQIRTSRAPAIFLDSSDNVTLAQQLADETGVTVVTELHLESLTDGAPAATYLDLMKYNVTQIVKALK